MSEYVSIPAILQYGGQPPPDLSALQDPVTLWVVQVEQRQHGPAPTQALTPSASLDRPAALTDPNRDAITPVYPLEYALSIGALGLAAGTAGLAEDAVVTARSAGRAVLRRLRPTAEPPVPDLAAIQKLEREAASAASVRDKLMRYSLNLEHTDGGPKARWFQRTLGFTTENMEQLAKQLVFDEKLAVQRGVTEHGVKFSQTINVVGANGRTLPVMTGWIRENGAVRLTTAYPGK